MPHLIVDAFKPINVPLERDGVCFDILATNIHMPGEKLIGVRVEEKKFFLVVREQPNKTVIKSDKTTRPSSVATLHRALLAYADAADLNIVASNVVRGKQNPHLKHTEALKQIDFFVDSFPQEKEVWIEVGFGSGRHLLYMAKQHPEILFIGIEIHRPSIEQVLKQINIQNLTNVLLIDYDARLFMEQVPSNIVGRIFVHFPVPWDKKPHRRVISKSFVDEALRVLKPKGRLELRTDSENYYAYAYETFTALHKTELIVRKNKDAAISSKYEDRWKRMEKNIYDLILINDSISPPLRIEGDFRFPKGKEPLQGLVKTHGKKIVKERFFIHFERIYETITGDLLAKISLGSFDRPEHLYLFYKDETLAYFPQNPLLSRANVAAHNTIKEVLYG